MTPRAAVMISGRGTNMVSIARRVQSGLVDMDIRFVGCDNPQAGGLEAAASLGLTTAVFSYASRNRTKAEREMLDALERDNVNWLVLAGFMKILSAGFISSFRGRIVNIHPSLLPSFPGTHAIEKAWRSGVHVSGVTVHYVDEQVDHGPILAQEPVRIHPDDTLEDFETRIHSVEHRLYPDTLALLLQGNLEPFSRGGA